METVLKNKKNKTRISAFLPTFLLDEVEKFSKKQNLTKSFIIEKALQDWFLKKLNSDVKDLSKMSFDDLPDEENWNLIQTKI